MGKFVTCGATVLVVIALANLFVGVEHWLAGDYERAVLGAGLWVVGVMTADWALRQWRWMETWGDDF